MRFIYENIYVLHILSFDKHLNLNIFQRKSNDFAGIYFLQNSEIQGSIERSNFKKSFELFLDFKNEQNSWEW